MVTLRAYLLALVSGLVTAAPPRRPKKCDVLFNGRIPWNAKATDFDDPSSIYNNAYILGLNQTWSEVLKFPPVLPSLFDRPRRKSVEVTLNNESIFTPGGNAQTGFRRSELLPALNNGTDSTVQGTTTFHFSVRTDPYRPLNYSHEYHPVWHETNDYSANQFGLFSGKPFGTSDSGPTVPRSRILRLGGRQSESSPKTFFNTSFDTNVWHNFAVRVGWTTNRIIVYYSKGYTALRHAAGPTYNDNSGGGQFHIGMFKLPTGPLGIDVVREGYQQPNLNEGLIYGGIFIERSDDGCVTLSP